MNPVSHGSTGHAGCTTAVVAVDRLSSGLVERMAALYLDHYDGTSEALFRRDLGNKDEAILLYAGKELAGFTLLKAFPFQWQGRNIQVIYSGDTIVAPAYWGQQQLAFTWIARAGAVKRRQPEVPLYWLLLVKGHRTYRYLPAFCRTYFPGREGAGNELEPLAASLAESLFGPDYRRASGLVEFPESRGHLKQALACPSPAELARPATRYFLRRNPAYLRGHELVCLCELAADNLRPLAARIFRRALDEADDRAA